MRDRNYRNAVRNASRSAGSSVTALLRSVRGALLMAVALLGITGILSGCTTEGRVRYVDGGYRKVFPDRTGGYYYVNSHAEKVHLDQLPSDDDPIAEAKRDLR